MKTSYQLELDRHRALDAMREAQRKEREAAGWRNRILSADEQTEYDRLRAASDRLPTRLAHRAAWPTYLVLVIWAAVLIFLMFRLMARSGPIPTPDRIAWVVVFLLVLVGGLVVALTLMSRRNRTATARYRAACALALDDYLARIHYGERLGKAKSDAADAAWDPSELRRPTRSSRSSWSTSSSSRNSRYGRGR